MALSDGTTIPQLGFGTLNVPPDREATQENTAKTAEIVGLALEAGYRHIDTAQMYGNERGVGQAIAASGIPREELYVTSKLGNGNHRRDDVRLSFEETLEKLALEQLDLFLMHWPLPTLYDGDYVSTWRAMTELVADGQLRSAGVSNFQPDHLERIITETGVVPVVNQIEAHPYFLNDTARKASRSHGIALEAWSPLGQGKLLEDPVICRIASHKAKTSAQVILRWHIQHGHIVFPKSVQPERMQENLELFDVELSADEVEAIDALNRGENGRIGPNPDTFEWIPSPTQTHPA
ncbi:MAG: aldo/keto reductase [Solirubrobacterales bacterium]|nr:aldo/keto reductase [Solirubrobacterales bacterium]